MKVGDSLRCKYSQVEFFFVEGHLYPILGFDEDNDPILQDRNGEPTPLGCPLDGSVWKFEPVNEEEEMQALVKILDMSQKDFEEGRVMTREQLMERLNKD